MLYHAGESLRLLAIYLSPFMPGSMARAQTQLGLPPLTPDAWATETEWGRLPAGTQLQKPEPIFPRIEIARER